MKLISMTDFVLQQDITDIKQIDSIVKYANFLKQPLKLEMFVTCDEDGIFLEDIIGHGMIHNYSEKVKQYGQAKEKVLFEGFEFTDSQKYSLNNRIKLSVSPYGLNDERLLLTKLNEENKFHTWLQLFTIEDLIQCDLELTPNAIKRIFN